MAPRQLWRRGARACPCETRPTRRAHPPTLTFRRGRQTATPTHPEHRLASWPIGPLYPNPSNRTALRSRIFGRTSSRRVRFAKSASQRSGVSNG
jgi:hypothetical protein